ncbi:unnamed protein product [Lactuca virosa]|uniref:Importin N-terminal domain-containing protein n=1 Tax=Lactuca virosa TaxID=75947 RepID=A0AAU9LB72_9ASTR|nr:unnamed protein product [Lactuca virosa]
MEFAEFLSAAVSEEAEVQSTVPKKLKKLKEENLSQFLVSLSEELSNENKSLKSRGLAGIVLKNSLEDWVNMKILIKNKIKQLLLDTLGSPNPEAGHTAAQVIAKIASIDIPRNDWSNFICTLCSNMSQQDKPILMQASLVSLAYVCEEISHYPLTQNQVNIVLEAVVNVINVSQESGVRLAAVTALYNTLNLARPNFEIEVDRIWIMGVVCEVAKDKDTHIKRKAFECLVSIASTYYDFLECHISTLYVLTTKAF